MKKHKRAQSIAPRCPYCGGHSILRSADGIYKREGTDTMLYVCKNYPACDSYVRVHKGTKIPVGMMANGKLRSLRRETHHYFDQLYTKGLMTKQEAYLWLAAVLAVPLEHAHIGLLGEYYCKTVMDESKKILEAWERKQTKQTDAIFGPKVRKMENGPGKILM